jgi:hypothetical protein
MFRKAIETARHFTFPVVLSRMSMAGTLEASIGSFVVINSDGWIVTAAHIFDGLDAMIAGARAVTAYRAKEVAIHADPNISDEDRIDALRAHALGGPAFETTEHCSAWWGADSLSITDVHTLSDMDLGVGRLVGFDASSVAAYPVFKDPAKPIPQGASLVKLGYPFNSITPMRDPGSGVFSFPVGAFPLPSFPMEGMLTREIQGKTTAPLPYPTLWLETSSPGLRGQSGGPTIDEQGTIWAIQSKTLSLPLNFAPQVPGGKEGETEHQFLNVGRGVHCATILGFLDSIGLKYELSNY